MRYQEIQPNAAAARFVRAYWILEDDDPFRVHRIVPDGRAQLILNLGRPYEACADGVWTRQPQCFLIGQITGPLMLRSSGAVRMIGLTFHPHTAGRLLNVPIGELTDKAVSVDDISRDLHRLVQEIETPDQAGALDGMVLSLAKRAGREDGVLAGAVGEVESGGTLLSVEEIARQAGLSARQFERRFRQAVGIPPKLFSRMQRFQRVFAALEGARTGWADAAIRCGYYDQAHLIRDFREFAGKPPAVLLSEESDLARDFVQRTKVSHFSNPRAGASR